VKTLLHGFVSRFDVTRIRSPLHSPVWLMRRKLSEPAMMSPGGLVVQKPCMCVLRSMPVDSLPRETTHTCDTGMSMPFERHRLQNLFLNCAHEGGHMDSRLLGRGGGMRGWTCDGGAATYVALAYLEAWDAGRHVVLELGSPA
jgi:hypothetical protein